MTIINDRTARSVPARLRASRVLAGLDQADIAAQLGVARSTVSAWEQGRTEPSVTYFVLWAEATGQSLDWFAEGVRARRDSNPQPSDP